MLFGARVNQVNPTLSADVGSTLDAAGSIEVGKAVVESLPRQCAPLCFSRLPVVSHWAAGRWRSATAQAAPAGTPGALTPAAAAQAPTAGGDRQAGRTGARALRRRQPALRRRPLPRGHPRVPGRLRPGPAAELPGEPGTGLPQAGRSEPGQGILRRLRAGPAPEQRPARPGAAGAGGDRGAACRSRRAARPARLRPGAGCPGRHRRPPRRRAICRPGTPPARPTTWRWALAGAGLALAGTGLVFQLRAKSASDKLTSLDRQGEPFDPALETRGRRDQRIGIALLAAGGAALATAITLYLLSDTETERSSYAHQARGHGSDTQLLSSDTSRLQRLWVTLAAWPLLPKPPARATPAPSSSSGRRAT